MHRPIIPPKPYLRRPEWAGPLPELAPNPNDDRPPQIRYDPNDTPVAAFLLEDRLWPREEVKNQPGFTL